MKKLIVIFVLSFFLFSCQKSENLIVNEVEKTDQEIVQIILKNEEFKQFNTNLSKIVQLSNIARVNRNKNLDGLNSIAKKVISRETATSFLIELGLLNSDQIILLNEQNYNILNKIIAEIPSLKKSQQNRIINLFNLAIISSKNQTELDKYLIRSNDICSSAYGSGMNNCSNELALELGAAAVAGAAGSLAGSPAAGAMIYFGGVALAYMHEHSCRQNVVGVWQVCRAEHPLH
jgi:hypothetical protein